MVPVETIVAAGTSVELVITITPHLSAPAGIGTVNETDVPSVVALYLVQSDDKGGGKRPIPTEDPRFEYCACLPISNDNR